MSAAHECVVELSGISTALSGVCHLLSLRNPEEVVPAEEIRALLRPFSARMEELVMELLAEVH